MGNLYLDALSEFNRKVITCRRALKIAKLSMSLERRLLYHKAYIEQRKRHIVDDTRLWDYISALHENYIRLGWARRGKVPDMSSPRTLGEKIEWLKLNYHRAILVQITDKLASREYAAEKTGSRCLLNHVYGIYEKVSDIEFESLPDQYVIKTNRSCGDILIHYGSNPIKNCQLANLDRILFGHHGKRKAEWPYWHVPPKVFVEEYLQGSDGELYDYKIFCFNGEPRLVRVGGGRFRGDQRVSYFDINWNIMPFRDKKAPSLRQGRNFPRPKSLEKMLHFAMLISEDLPFLRVDFYDIFGTCRLGELTLYHESGLDCEFHPEKWDLIVGDWLSLPKPVRNPKFAYGISLS